MLVSGIQQSDSVIYTYIYIYISFFRFFSIIGHYRVLSRVPCSTALYSRFLLVIYFILFYFQLHWVLVAVHGLPLVEARGGYSSLWCTGFSLRWLLLLRNTGSRCAGFSSCGSQALERKLSSCGTWAQLLHGMWDLPGPGLKPVSPTLAGGSLTTAPPGKSQLSILYIVVYICQSQSPNLSLPTLSPVNHKSVFYICDSTSVLQRR